MGLDTATKIRIGLRKNRDQWLGSATVETGQKPKDPQGGGGGGVREIHTILIIYFLKYKRPDRSMFFEAIISRTSLATEFRFCTHNYTQLPLLLAGASGWCFWRVLLAGASGGCFWRVLLADLPFGAPKIKKDGFLEF